MFIVVDELDAALSYTCFRFRGVHDILPAAREVPKVDHRGPPRCPGARWDPLCLRCPGTRTCQQPLWWDPLHPLALHRTAPYSCSWTPTPLHSRIVAQSAPSHWNTTWTEGPVSGSNHIDSQCIIDHMNYDHTSGPYGLHRHISVLKEDSELQKVKFLDKKMASRIWT